ncbi:MAG: hypothetical protein RLZZ301_383 [Bacteroidota bacterium]|jgi:predicted nucleic acid-binding Zn ribbon protein
MSDEFKRSSNDQPLGELVNRLLKAYGLEDKMKVYRLIEAWPELMGPAVASRTKDIRIQDNVLYLKIDSSVMRDELFNGKQLILERCNAYVGETILRDIWFS